jgi:hypothetical protein
MIAAQAFLYGSLNEWVVRLEQVLGKGELPLSAMAIGKILQIGTKTGCVCAIT